MSNDTQNSRDSGDSRRRRSRGGQKRRNNNNPENRDSTGRQPGGGKRQGGNRQGGRQQGANSGKPQRRPMPAPVKLTWFQKLMKTIGLYKEPVRPPRPERRPDATKKTREPREREPREKREPRKSKTRDARSEGDRSKGTRRDDSAPRRGAKRERGGREGNRPRGGDPSTVENRRVYIGNLSYDTTESDLEELFKGIGPVRRVEIVYNRSTHRSKGYGFIEMLDVDEAKRTVEVLHDQFFMGRQLTVSGAKSKDHEDAEKDDEKNIASNQEMPPLAPIKPEVTSLIDEPTTAEEPIPEAPKTEETPQIDAVVAEENTEVPTEEFSPEVDTPEEVKEQINS